jgi:hypothetical protein
MKMSLKVKPGRRAALAAPRREAGRVPADEPHSGSAALSVRSGVVGTDRQPPVSDHVQGPLIWNAYTPLRLTVSDPSKLLLSLMSLVLSLFSVAK